MEIEFASSKLARVFNAERELVKAYGKDTAKKIRVRMAVLRSVASLADVWRSEERS